MNVFKVIQRLSECHVLYEIQVVPVHCTALYRTENVVDRYYVINGNKSVPKLYKDGSIHLPLARTELCYCKFAFPFMAMWRGRPEIYNNPRTVTLGQRWNISANYVPRLKNVRDISKFISTDLDFGNRSQKCP